MVVKIQVSIRSVNLEKNWIYNRKDRTDYYVAWYENGKQCTKVLPTKALAKHYAQIKYQQLNSDVFLSSINMLWGEAKKQFLMRYDIIRVATNTKK